MNALEAETGHFIKSDDSAENTNDPWVFNDLVKPPPPTNPNMENSKEFCKVFNLFLFLNF